MRIRGFAAVALLAAGVSFCAVVAHAKALPDKMKNALNHMAQVIVIDNNCSKLESNETRIAILMTMFAINLDDPDQKKYLTERVRYHGSDIGKMDEASICMAGLLLYGPNGVNVPGLVKTK